MAKGAAAPKARLKISLSRNLIAFKTKMMEAGVDGCVKKVDVFLTRDPQIWW